MQLLWTKADESSQINEIINNYNAMKDINRAPGIFKYELKPLRRRPVIADNDMHDDAIRHILLDLEQGKFIPSL